ncbi:MAG: ATP-binding protein [Ktedonobacterales bacterium]
MSRTHDISGERHERAGSNTVVISDTLVERVLELAPDAVLLVDAGGHIELVNQQAETIFGYTRDELLGMTVESLIPQHLRSRHPAHRAHYASQSHTRPMGSGLDLHALRKDGIEFPVEISLSPIKIDGELHIISAIRDVTDQRALERRTRESLEALLAMAEAMARLPAEHTDGQEDDAAAQVVGARLVELTYRMLGCQAVSLARIDPQTETLHPLAVVGRDPDSERRWRLTIEGLRLEDRVRDARLRKRLHTGDTITLDMARDGGKQLDEIPGERVRLMVPMRMGDRLIGVLGVSFDKLEQAASADQRTLAEAVGKLGALVIEWDTVLAERRAYAEAEARRALLQMVIDEMPSGIYLVRGPDSRLVLANHAAEQVWGASWTPGQTMGEFLRATGVRIFTPDGHELADDELGTNQTVRTGSEIRHHEEIIRHPDGTTQPILFNAVPLDARILGWTHSVASNVRNTREPWERGALVVLQDVSALKEAERLKDEFIAIAAHELRTPMTAIRGYATMLLRHSQRQENNSDSDNADIQREALETIDQATSRLAELTDDLLDVARLQAGRLDLRLEPQDLVSLVRRVIKRAQITTQRHQIELRDAPETVVVDIDIQRFEQVLGNLLSNAIKYAPEGGPIELMIQQMIDADAHQSALLTIADHGIGIPFDQQSRLFTRFSRALNARERGISGTGLGLYLCKELVERHNGRIWFESQEGSGTTFYISLPLHVEESQDTHTAS